MRSSRHPHSISALTRNFPGNHFLIQPYRRADLALQFAPEPIFHDNHQLLHCRYDAANLNEAPKFGGNVSQEVQQEVHTYIKVASSFNCRQRKAEYTDLAHG